LVPDLVRASAKGLGAGRSVGLKRAEAGGPFVDAMRQNLRSSGAKSLLGSRSRARCLRLTARPPPPPAAPPGARRRGGRRAGGAHAGWDQHRGRRPPEPPGPSSPGTTLYASCTAEGALFGSVSDQDGSQRWCAVIASSPSLTDGSLTTQCAGAGTARGRTPTPRRSMPCPNLPTRTTVVSRWPRWCSCTPRRSAVFYMTHVSSDDVTDRLVAVAISDDLSGVRASLGRSPMCSALSRHPHEGLSLRCSCPQVAPCIATYALTRTFLRLRSGA
jgi:hypothetical protein